jgi:predicted MFS family arabinose efflux permease
MTRTRGPAVEVGERHVAALGRAPVGLVWAMSLVIFAQVAGEVSARTFVNVYLDRGLGVTSETIGPIFALAQLVGVAAALSMPFFARRLGIGRTFVFSTVALAIAVLPLGLVAAARAAGLGYVGIVAAASIARPCIIVYQLELVSQEWRGLMAAGTTVAYGASAGLVALAGGYAIASAGYAVVFLTCGLVSLVGAGLFWAFFRTPRGEYARQSALESSGAAVAEEA